LQSKVEANSASSLDTPAERMSSLEDGVIRPWWLRFVIPSVGDLVFVLLLVALTYGPLAKGLLGDAGIGWHIRTGELVLKTHSVPRADPFSSSMYGKAWFAWEWLYDAVVGAVHGTTGLNGVVFATALLIALTFGLLLRRMLASGANLPVAVALLLLAMAASTIHFLARPHVLSWLFMVLWFGALEKFVRDGRPRSLLWLLPLMMLWANLHGGFLVGLVLLGIYVVSALLDGWAARASEDRKVAFSRARTLAALAVASLLVTLVNPYGYQLHLHIYRYLSDRFLMDHIDEFLSPNFHGLAQKCFAALVLLAVVGAGAARKRLRTSHVLVILFAIYSGLYSARNIPASSLLLALVVAPQLSLVLKEMAGSREASDGLRRAMSHVNRFGSRMAAFDANLQGHIWPIVAVMLGIWACAHQGHIGGFHLMDAQFDGKRFPVQAVDLVKQTGNREPIFCPDRWGGYVIYRMYPEQKVAVDDRHDLYGSEFLKRYLKIMHGELDWDKNLAELHAGWVLVPQDSALVSLLSAGGVWRAVYRDNTAVLFRKGEAEIGARP
jgi:hypothetical protein